MTVPLDSRLPGGGGNQICGLFDLNPARVGQIDRITTSANNFGDRIQHWNGFDATVNARMDNGLLLQGGWSAGRTLTDDCDIRANLDNPSQHHCRVETPFITDVKFLGSYTLPYDIQIAATFQSIQGPPLLAEVNYSRDEIAASLGRFPTSSASDDIQVIPPGTEYGERLNQVDLRFTKIFTFGPARVQAMVDFYNLFNNSSELILNDGYGAASLGGPNWPLLGAVVPGTLLKFGFQVDF